MKLGIGPNNGDGKKTLFPLAIVLEAIATPLELFLHKGFGERYLNTQAILAIPIILVFGSLFRGADQRPLTALVIAYMVMCVVTRIGILWRRGRGTLPCHTRYAGQPRVMTRFPRLSELTVKRLESVAVFVIGAIARTLNEPLGMYLMLASAALFINVTLAVIYDRQRLLDLKDAMHDQAAVLERFRNQR